METKKFNFVSQVMWDWFEAWVCKEQDYFIIIMPIILGFERKNVRQCSKKGCQKGQCNDWAKTSYDQFTFFTSNHSYSDSFGKDYNVSLFVIWKYVYFKVRIHSIYFWVLNTRKVLKVGGRGRIFPKTW